jgi:predicted nucleic acid-binding protein
MNDHNGEVFIDTTFFLALFDPRYELHEPCKEFMRQAVRDIPNRKVPYLVTSSMHFDKAAYLIATTLQNNAWDRFISTIKMARIAILPSTHEIYQMTLESYLSWCRKHKSISFADVFVLHLFKTDYRALNVATCRTEKFEILGMQSRIIKLHPIA